MDTLTLWLITVTCTLALSAEVVIAIVRRNILHACLAVALSVVLVIYVLSLIGTTEPVELRIPLRIARSGIMLTLFLLHRNAATNDLSVLRHKVTMWKRRRRS